MCVCVHVLCACERVCVRACVRACVCVIIVWVGECGLFESCIYLLYLFLFYF